MKKVLALLMAGMMTVACPVMASAEEVQTIDFSMMDETAYEGTWVTAFGVFDLYLPTDWNVLVNVQEGEEAENNLYFQAANEEGTYSVGISAAETELDLEGFAAQLAESGYEAVSFAVINDIPVVTYSADTEEVAVGGFCAIGGNVVYNVTLGAPAGDEDFQPIAQNIICSFSATEAEAETEA